MNRIYTSIAAFLGLLTIVIGAFGAHSLKESLDPQSLQSYETGVRYMMYHVLGILIVHNSTLLSEKSKGKITLLFLAGILLFSGSIFVIAIDLIPAKRIWFITPIGGLLFILGWLTAGIAFLRSEKKVNE